MDAPPVVLLHGWGGTFASTWGGDGWPRDLEAAGRSAVPIDLPGHGGPASADPEAYADLAGALDDRLPQGALDAVGFSLGGKLALALAVRRPDRFRRLVIAGVGDNLFAPEPSGEAVATALVDGVTDETPAAVAALVRYAAVPGNDPRALAAVLRRPSNPRVAEEDLSRVGGVLLVNGDRDTIAISDERLQRALPQARAVRLGGVDHFSLPSSPAFRELTLDHLSNGRFNHRDAP